MGDLTQMARGQQIELSALPLLVTSRTDRQREGTSQVDSTLPFQQDGGSFLIPAPAAAQAEKPPHFESPTYCNGLLVPNSILHSALLSLGKKKECLS